MPFLKTRNMSLDLLREVASFRVELPGKSNQKESNSWIWVIPLTYATQDLLMHEFEFFPTQSRKDQSYTTPATSFRFDFSRLITDNQ